MGRGAGLAIGNAGPRLAATVALVYAFLPIPPAFSASTEWNYNLTMRTRNLVEGVAGGRERHPSQAILLYGVDADLFWNAVRDHPFRLFGIDHVYLAPGTEHHLEMRPQWAA